MRPPRTRVYGEATTTTGRFPHAWQPLPFYDEPSAGRYLVHLGGSYSFRHIDGLTTGATANQNVAYSTLNGLAEFTKRSWVGSQGPIGFGAEADSDQWNQINGEFLVIWGATSVQSEYFQVLMNSGENYQGGYAFFSYFLTGESRGYRKETKTIDRIIPFEPFFWIDACKGAACGRGAWEVAVGYSWVDLDDGTRHRRHHAGHGGQSAPRIQQRLHRRRELVPQPVVAHDVQL